VLQLYPLQDGALLARTRDGAVRSDDGGDSWQPLDLPPLTNRLSFENFPNFHSYLAVESWNADVMFAGADLGLYRSRPGEDGWQLVLPLRQAPFSGGDSIRIVVSGPPSSHEMYAVVGEGAGGACCRDLRLLTSEDDGGNWQQVWAMAQSGPLTCSLAITLLQAHSEATGRLFSFTACGTGSAINGTHFLNVSNDDGSSWSPVGGWFGVWLTHLGGGSPTAPQRFYLAGTVPVSNAPGSILARSDDDAQSWQDVGEGLWDISISIGRRPTITGLVVDPGNPDELYVSLAHSGDGVWESSDGGHTWQDIGLEGVGRISDLVLSADGQSLYAGTDRGVWRLTLPTVVSG
jgi:hypothetical protein